MNNVILLGRLTKDPEVLNNATKITVATSKTWRDKSGEKQEKAQFHNCIAFGKTAEIISEHFTKGKQILVDGEIEYSQYEKNGETRYSTSIVINKFDFC